MPYSHEKFITLAGLNQTVPRCQALSKRSQEQCRKAAVRGKAGSAGCTAVASTGPKLVQKVESVALKLSLCMDGRRDPLEKLGQKSFER